MKLSIFRYLPFFATVIMAVTNSILIKTQVAYTLNGEKFTYLIPDELVYGLFGITLVLVFVLLKSEYWKYAYTIVLVAAIFRFIQFSPRTYSIMNLETTASFLLLFHVALNWVEVKRDLKKVLNFGETTPTANEKLILHFELKFKDKSVEELHHIVNSNQYSAEAVEAATRLIKQLT